MIEVCRADDWSSHTSKRDMLSLFCKKLSAVETQLESHTEIINDLQIMLDVDETGHRKVKVDNGWIGLRRLMANVEAQINRMDARLDELGMKIGQNDAEICDLRSRLAWYQSGGGTGESGARNGAGQQIRQGLPQGGDDESQEALTRTMRTDQPIVWIGSKDADLGRPPEGVRAPHAPDSADENRLRNAPDFPESSTPSSGPAAPAAAAAAGGPVQVPPYRFDQLQPKDNSRLPTSGGDLLPTRNPGPSYADTVRVRPGGVGSRDDGGNAKAGLSKPCRPQETSEPVRLDDSARNKEKMKVLRDEIEKRDTLIQDLMANHVQLARKEKEIAKKEEWYEHKMRLLKQDKRRRGETIGKLLRCLDDMKDQGRLDETKVTDGRLVLAATINSRGLSMEDRIFAAVEAMETERAAQRAQAAADVTDEAQIDADDDFSPPPPTTLLEFQSQLRFPIAGVARQWPASQ